MEALAEINGRATSAHEEARAALSKTARNYCPLGCVAEELDEYGYCHHLVGFTADRKTLEPIAPLYRTMNDGTPFNTGFKTVTGSQPCQEGDLFINPERPQVVHGITHMAKAWVSDRVYRRRERPAEELAIPPEPSQLFQLQARKKELERKLQEKRLKEEIGQLEDELGQRQPEHPVSASEELLRQEVDRMETELATEPVVKCDQCGFIAKSAQGLVAHKRSHKPDQGEQT